jgi:tRNA-splicing ligase RtcB
MGNSSFKYQVQQVEENKYILPAKEDIKVDIHAFLSEELYQASEENMWSQAVNAANYEGVQSVYLMPDCHSGFGVPIGSVVVTDNTIIQSSVGYDISCGIIMARVNGLTATDLTRRSRESWITEVEKRVALGIGCNRPKLMPEFKKATIENVLRYGAKAIGINADVCERQFIPVSDTAKVDLVTKAFEKAMPQFGSLGGGNHFIELQVDQDGSVWVMAHCGSRGFGYQTAEYFFYEGAKQRNLASNRRELSWLRYDEPLGKQYWDHHNMAANYATANRQIIMRSLSEAFQKVYNTDLEVYYDISHNLVQQETVISNGVAKKCFVHRKGATRAMPSNHPNLIGTKWIDTGHPCLIPGSMTEGAAILIPQSNAYNSACSVNHGAGRVMARGEAKRKLEHKQEEIDSEMHDMVRQFRGVDVGGIITNTKHVPLDECNKVYKDLDTVLNVLLNNGIATISHRLYPVAVLKGTD